MAERRFPLVRAELLAERIRDVLTPACERIVIAGSIRRREPTVKDVELVAIPRLRAGLFGPEPTAPTELDVLVDELIAAGRLEPRPTKAGVTRRGRRYQALRATATGIGVDLFIVRPPASWGATLAIRTGPAEYSRRLVSECREHGLVCDGARLRRVVRDGVVLAVPEDVETPEERDFIEACGLPWSEPEDRR